MFALIMTKKRIITLIIISFISGAILGGTGVFVYLGHTVSNSMAFLSMQNRADWEMRAFDAYKNDSAEIGIWALTNLSEILLEDEKTIGDNNDLILKDLLLAYGRLSLVFQSQNDYQNFSKYISKAMDLSKKIYPNEFQSELELIAFVKEFDKLGNKSNE